MKFRRKPEIVDAVQYTPGLEEGITEFDAGARPYLTVGLSRRYMRPTDYILTHSDGSLSIVSEKSMNKHWEKIGCQ